MIFAILNNYTDIKYSCNKYGMFVTLTWNAEGALPYKSFPQISSKPTGGGTPPLHHRPEITNAVRKQSRSLAESKRVYERSVSVVARM